MCEQNKHGQCGLGMNIVYISQQRHTQHIFFFTKMFDLKPIRAYKTFGADNFQKSYLYIFFK